MGDSTGISWTDATWNPVRGCTRVSAGCVHCYAERVANRFSGPGKPYEGLVSQQGRWNGVVRMVPDHLADPLRWKKPRRIFVNSMSDLFHEGLADEEIAAVFGVMAAAPQHTFQVLTKRAKRMREWFEWAGEHGAIDVCLREAFMHLDSGDVDGPIERATHNDRPTQWPLPNVWLGVSVENQEAADERITELLRTPAAVRFLSCEPLIGPVDLAAASPNARSAAEDLDWVIAGCESGPGARTCAITWLRALRDQCAAAHVPYFLKQATAAWERGPDPKRPANTIPIAISIGPGAGSKEKHGGVIELPYLDGVQHAEFPTVRHG